ncbi:nuclear exosome regulator NRDE2 [Ochlerotatus camptorhynchus]|uniref:nuclear exosome regulator NRDE2 n=1 Tax=Ochlerotatus camptorhynchus TaxID=644619 RepID=UPI0031DCD85F
MSLFPAYTTTAISDSQGQVPAQTSDLAWLTNQSFIAFPSTVQEDDSASEEEEHKPSNSVHRHRDRKRKRKKKHHKKEKKHRKQGGSDSNGSTSHSERSDDDRKKVKKVEQQPVRVSELDFYTDVDALRIYLTVETLHRPACPKYKLGPYRFDRLGWRKRGVKVQRYFRYFKKFRENASGGGSEGNVLDKEMELEKAARGDSSVEKWIEYYRFKQDNPIHADSYQNHKAELAVVERAMQRHPDDDQLMELYMDGIVKVYPTDEVLELIQKQIRMDNTNVLLWDALISNKQSSMAQCIAPNVLKLYEKSIRSLFLAKRSDEVMLKFFKKCAIFCRQSGLWEQFFGLVQLTISLNVSGNFGSGRHLFVSPEHNNQLIEYEELILKSGLPMNEIWLRIEKLRSAFHFLPFQGSHMCGDPQRMVLQEDIIGFVYPLINKEYAFDLVILILKMMKYPFESCAFERCSFFEPEPYESDHSEQLLPLFLDLNRNKKVDSIVLNMIKELNTPPSFINTNLAFESYLDLMRAFLISAAEHFSDEKNVILLLLYLKLERILLVFDKHSGPLTDERKKATRSRVKNLLKKSKYQNNLNFYIEYGLIEYEMEELGPSCVKIFKTSVQVFCAQDDQLDDNDLFTLVLKLTEVLLKEGQKTQAIYIMTKLALNPKTISFDSAETVTDPTKLLALQKFNERANQCLTKDSQVDEFMSLEQYFITNPLINGLRAYLYYMALIKSKAETTKKIDGFLFHFNDRDNPRHRFVREQLFEIYLKILEFRLEEFSNDCFLQVIDRVLHEYPENLTAIRMCTYSESLSWFQIRTILGKHLTTKSVLLLVTAARIRNLYSIQKQTAEEETYDDQVYKRRILNLLKHSVRRESTLRQNALLWRLYLRELFDQPGGDSGGNALEQCKRTLYMALEACPWNKVLYLDGAFFAPQELSQLLDLLLEKQLRIHAIPEELEILRNE